MLEENWVEGQLCIYDERNPDNLREFMDDHQPRQGCHCDNCFYGRDRLAVEVLNLREIIRLYREIKK